MLTSKLLSNSARGRAPIPARRSLCHKTYLKPKANNYHWPYERRSYGLLNFWMDPFTKSKFDENSLLIQVEGNVSAGKQDFAKTLAEELGMAYFPQPDLDSYYINDHGYDYRALNPILPERLRICDWEMFHENPSRHSVIHMQYYLYKLRLFQHYKALRHIFNTGQGVVMTRTAFTERAIVEAMHNVGWLPKGHLREDGARFYDWKHRHTFLRNMTLSIIHQPHLCIYLDTPVDVCLERVRNDPDPMIANSKVHTREFLEEIETAFKEIVLPKAEHNMHLIAVDNTKPKTREEVCDIIDDLSHLSFKYDPHDTRFETWDTKNRRFWYLDARRRLTTRNATVEINQKLSAEWYDVAGLGDSITQADLRLRQSLFESHVGQFGFNQEYDTDPKVHGIFRRLFGTYKNFGERVNKDLRADFV
uniref:NADH dehydrogenase [ubiquinone] 1 alpha subcomplex subunit 10, mitochondrial n=1 Tax=Aceria tosichella TaxID=561515 RepID=A0A6G1SIY1_9ACAR